MNSHRCIQLCTTLLFLSCLSSAVPTVSDSKIATLNRQHVSAPYLLVQESGEHLYDGFSICPSEISSSGITVECVTPEDEVHFYIDGAWASKDDTRPYTLSGNIPSGSVSIRCDTELWKTKVTGSFGCQSAPSSGDYPGLVGSGGFSRVWPSTGTRPSSRLEACVSISGGKIYMIGGLDAVYPVAVYDPVSATWENRGMAPTEFHHHQCATYGKFIYVAGSWRGRYPNQPANEDTYIYDTENDSWSTTPRLPEWRRRGGGGVAIHDGKLYLGAGSSGGHGPATTLRPYLDVLDLNDMSAGWFMKDNVPDGRDHAQGGIASGYFCIAGGRNGSKVNFMGSPIMPLNCFNIATDRWERRADIPEARSGVLVTGTCQGLLMIGGGEGGGSAHERVDLYDPRTDTFLPPTYFNQKRHGSGAARSACECGNIYVVAGGGSQGVGTELNDIEVWSPDGEFRKC